MNRGDLVVFFENQFGEYNTTSFHVKGFEGGKTFVGKLATGIVMTEQISDIGYTFCQIYTNSGTHYISVNDLLLAEEFLNGKSRE